MSSPTPLFWVPPPLLTPRAVTPFSLSCARILSRQVQDGLIHKTEFCLALFNNADHDSLFANRVFEIFDKKKNNVIEFGEFVQALSVFHPKAPLAEKAECACWDSYSCWALRCCASDACDLPPPPPPPPPPPRDARTRAVAFRIYDLGNTGEINREEVRTMLRAFLKEDPAMQRLPPAALESIIDRTFTVAGQEVRLSNEDSIGPGEWLAFVNKMPQILNKMTLPVLRDLTTAFPSFLLNSTASNSDMMKLGAHEEFREALKAAKDAAAAYGKANAAQAAQGGAAPATGQDKDRHR